MTLFVFAACSGDDDSADDAERLREAVENGRDDDEVRDLAEDVRDNPRGQVDVDACELLRREDAEALFGVEAMPPSDLSDPEIGVACSWQSAEEPGAQGIGHLLFFRVYGGEAYYGDAFYDNERPVEELGDRAFIVEDPVTRGLDLQWVQNGSTLTMNYSTLAFDDGEGVDVVDIAAAEAEMVELARDVARRAARQLPRATTTTIAGSGATTSTTAATEPTGGE